LSVLRKEIINQNAFKYLVSIKRPEAVLFLNLSRGSVSLAHLAQEMNLPFLFYIADSWFSMWELDHWYQMWRRTNRPQRALLKLLSRVCGISAPPAVLNVEMAVFASYYLKNVAEWLGKQVSNSQVIHWGVDVNHFAFRERIAQNPYRLLYVDQVLPQKGLHVLIEALGRLKRNTPYGNLRLSVLGDVTASRNYTIYIHELAYKWGVQDCISFEGAIPKERMPAYYASHDILVLPSICEEGFSTTLLEAMACGLPIVSAATGGNCEILEHQVNALVFPKEDAGTCADHLTRLLMEPELMQSIRKNGRLMVERRFTIEQMVTSLEDVLKQTLARCNVSKQNPKPKNEATERILVAETKSKFQSLLVYAGRKQGIYRLFSPRFCMRAMLLALHLAFSCVSVSLISFFFLLYNRIRSTVSRQSSAKNILITQLADIGDTVLSSPFLRELRRAFPSAWIGLVVQPGIHNLVETCPYVDEVFSFDWRIAKKWQRAVTGHPLWWSLGFQLARRSGWFNKRIDLAISTRWGNDGCQSASRICNYLSGAKQRISYHSPTEKVSSVSLSVDKVAAILSTAGPVMGFPKHEVERQLDILRFLGVNPMDNRLEVWPTEEDSSYAAMLLQEQMSTGRFLVGFAPGAGWSKRQWPIASFIGLGKWLQHDYDANIVIIGGKQDRALGEEIRRGLLESSFLNLAGMTTLRQIASVARHLTMVVSNDSGPMHIAAAVNVPTIGLFGSGEYQRFRPWGANHKVMRIDVPCCPCGEDCIFDQPHCILGLTVESVKEAVRARLEEIRSAKD
jgi:ADP-heptose:LPS heptosyltransferase/glycosyltransferase involved in cell wall biosynthesis